MLTVYLFFIGLALGSFYNVVGLRVPKGESVIKGRSHCTTCNRTLKASELVPVVSYLLQRGACKGCGSRIRPLYPVTELSTGLLFAVSYLSFGLSGEFFVAVIFISLFAIIFVSDMAYMIIPDKVLLFFLPLLLAARVYTPLTPWYDSLIGAVVGFLLLFVIIMASRGGMGAGDMKLFGVIGLVLGWKLTLLAFFLSTLYGTIGSISLLAFRIIDRKNPIPFGPYIILGSLTSYFIGDELLGWYLDWFL
ncbi:prepilin peptidase [Pontibacillus halophilus JSM 076056 = DSM 19796]|uniref:Prepilin peptidase n=1 Tax=Pontibacillus halophilus JSM 076056 = DSM 19796 TaxID=1385510 RepID=A0A0A5GQH0_9BACI|nr:prepilin peptidase [Pontibacillus halophilus JSM 076056 = DSM 19796]